MPAEPLLSRRRLNRATLARQLLLERASVEPTDAIERLGGFQAQEPASPYIALWTRLRDFSADALHGAFLERRVVKATLMRVTLHAVSGRDFWPFSAALAESHPTISRAHRDLVLGRRARTPRRARGAGAGLRVGTAHEQGDAEASGNARWPSRRSRPLVGDPHACPIRGHARRRALVLRPTAFARGCTLLARAFARLPGAGTGIPHQALSPRVRSGHDR